ncbi:ArsR family transcriptional regulator [Streptococcus sp. X16XC17]|uniref:helix-turn-helix transcriptional regulator n=1 Tax=unclassified Streptococcus TaxID=2608887 RepID=UPI00066FFE93|nr:MULTISPECIES: helix-turn-helix transcriptional regulator [unclassified Streptococcus]TCD46574.1 ArsR family transcriptional regulator [Streptococcus sp. X16XC17]
MKNKMIVENYRSQIVEQLFVSSLVHEREKDDQLLKKSAYFSETLTIYDTIQQLLLPYKEKIQQLVLSDFGYSNLLHQVYFRCLERGQDLKTIEDFHQVCLQLNAKEIQECLLLLLQTEESTATDFFELLEQSDFNADTKWYYWSFYHHPLGKMAELVDLSRELVTLYQPFLEIEKEKRQQYASSENLKMEVEDSQEKYHLTGTVFVFVLSSWFMRGYILKGIGKEFFYIQSLGMDEWGQNLSRLEEGHFYEILKLLGDPSRYQAILRLIEPDAKRNQIAEDLGITGAAVSFHTQKLLTAQLLQQNTQDKDIKYDANVELLKQVIAKLQSDFDV